MNLDLLKQLLAITTASRREDRMFAFLVNHIFGRKSVQWDDCALGPWNNILIRKGDGFVPCVAAHIDTGGRVMGAHATTASHPHEKDF